MKTVQCANFAPTLRIRSYLQVFSLACCPKKIWKLQPGHSSAPDSTTGNSPIDIISNDWQYRVTSAVYYVLLCLFLFLFSFFRLVFSVTGRFNMSTGDDPSLGLIIGVACGGGLLILALLLTTAGQCTPSDGLPLAWRVLEWIQYCTFLSHHP